MCTRHVHIISFGFIGWGISQLYDLGNYKIKDPDSYIKPSEWWSLDLNASLSSAETSVFSSLLYCIFSRNEWNLMKSLWPCSKWICLSHFLNACLFSLPLHFPWLYFQRCYPSLIAMLWCFLVSQSSRLKIITELATQHCNLWKKLWCVGLREGKETHALSWCSLQPPSLKKNRDICTQGALRKK